MKIKLLMKLTLSVNIVEFQIAYSAQHQKFVINVIKVQLTNTYQKTENHVLQVVQTGQTEIILTLQITSVQIVDLDVLFVMLILNALNVILICLALNSCLITKIVLENAYKANMVTNQILQIMFIRHAPKDVKLVLHTRSANNVIDTQAIIYYQLIKKHV